MVVPTQVPTIYPGSILDCEVDVIVNPANNHLRHGGGLARVIADAAAPRREQPDRHIGFRSYPPQDYLSEPSLSEWREDCEWQREQENAPLVPTGGALMTTSGRLPFKGIIHAVGPVWGGGTYAEPVLLRMAYSSALSVAEKHGFHSIAFPAISCGIFGYPVAEAARIAVQTCCITKLDVTFALMDAEHIDVFGNELDKVKRLFDGFNTNERW